jgi:serine/threonine-protein kinase RsbW
VDLRLILFLPRQPSTVTCSRIALTALLSLADTTDECCYELGLIVTEACTNAVVHSAPGSAVDISVVIEDRRCVLEIGNRGATGTGTTTRRRADPLRTGGRGLMLMAALADTVAFVPAAPGQVLLRVTKNLPRLPRR